MPWHSVLLAWLVGEGAAGLSPTPTGIGVVEVAITAALVAAGLRPSEAIAAVILYRLVTFKLVVTLGLAAYEPVRRRQDHARAAA